MAKSLKQEAQEICEEEYMQSEITRARSYDSRGTWNFFKQLMDYKIKLAKIKVIQ